MSAQSIVAIQDAVPKRRYSGKEIAAALGMSTSYVWKVLAAYHAGRPITAEKARLVVEYIEKKGASPERAKTTPPAESPVPAPVETCIEPEPAILAETREQPLSAYSLEQLIAEITQRMPKAYVVFK